MKYKKKKKCQDYFNHVNHQTIVPIKENNTISLYKKFLCLRISMSTSRGTIRRYKSLMNDTEGSTRLCLVGKHFSRFMTLPCQRRASLV